MSTKIIGTFEQVIFPEFGNELVSAKIDTGAYTGALHCSAIDEQEIDGNKFLIFTPFQQTNSVTKHDFVVKHVRSSNGTSQKRYFITTNVQVLGELYEITLSLADRSEMKWPVLIGRRFLSRNNFLVDPARLNGYGEQADRNQ